MATQRKTTVYDVTGLKVHTNGRRVNATGSTSRTRYWGPGTTRDHQKNAIVVDAGGPAEFSSYARNRGYWEDMGVSDEEGEDEEDEGEEEDVGEAEDAERKRKGKGKEPVRGKRPLKRRKFNKDLPFILPVSSSPISERTLPTADQTPLPSADLLKAVHHYAANYYEERGFILDVGQQYRQRQKKRRAKQKKARKAQGTDPRRESITEGEAESDWVGDEEEEGGGEEEEEEEEGGDGEGEEEEEDIMIPSNVEELGGPSFRGPGRPKRAVQYRDLYKALDGTALMAFGIVIQEYIRSTVQKAQPRHMSPTSTVSAQDPTTVESPDVHDFDDSNIEDGLLDGDTDFHWHPPMSLANDLDFYFDTNHP